MPFDFTKLPGDKADDEYSPSSELDRKLQAIINSDVPFDQKIEAAKLATEGQDAGEGLLERALNIVSKPLSITSGAIGTAAKAGHNIVFEHGDPTRSGFYKDADWEGFLKHVQENKGMGSLLEENRITGGARPEGGVLGSDWIKKPLGFAGDVGADPLSFVMPASAIEKLGTEGLARVAIEGGQKALGQKILTEGFAATSRAERAGLEEIARNTLDAAGKPLLAEGQSLSGGAKLRMPWMEGDGLHLWGGGDTTSARFAAQGTRAKNAVTQSELLKPIRTALGGNEGKQALQEMIRTGTPEEAANAFYTLDAVKEGRVVDAMTAAQLNRESASLKNNIRELGVDPKTVGRVLEGADPVTTWSHLQPWQAQELADNVRAFDDQVAMVANQNAGRNFIAMRPDHAPWLTTDEFKELMGPGRGKGWTMGGYAESGLEKRANLVAGGEFMGESLHPVNEEQLGRVLNAADNAEAEATRLFKEGDNVGAKAAAEEADRLRSLKVQELTPREQAAQILEKNFTDPATGKVSDDMVKMYDDDYFKAVDAQIRTTSRRTGRVATEEYLKRKGVAEDVFKTYQEATEAPAKLAQLRRSAATAGLEARIRLQQANPWGQAAKDARSVADLARAEEQAARRGRDIAFEQRNTARKGTNAMRELADIEYTAADAAGRARNAIEAKIAGNEAEAATNLADFRKAREELAATVDVQGATLRDAQAEVDKAWGDLADASQDVVIDERIAKGVERNELRGQIKSERATLKRQEGRKGYNVAKSEKRLAEANDRIAAIINNSPDVARADDLVAEHTANIAKLEELKQRNVIEEMAKINERAYETDPVTGEIKRWPDTGRPVELPVDHPESLHNQAKLAYLKGQGEEYERWIEEARQMRTAVERKRDLIREAYREKTRQALVEARGDKALAEVELAHWETRHAEGLDARRADLKAKEKRMRQLGRDDLADAVAAEAVKLPNVEEGGLAHADGQMWAHTMPDFVDLPAGREANVANMVERGMQGLASEADNLIGLNLSSDPRLAEQLAQMSGQTEPRMALARVEMKTPRTYTDPGVEALGPRGQMEARDYLQGSRTRKGGARGELDGDIFKAGYDSGDIDFAALDEPHEAYLPEDPSSADNWDHLIQPEDLEGFWTRVDGFMADNNYTTWGADGWKPSFKGEEPPAGDLIDAIAAVMHENNIVPINVTTEAGTAEVGFIRDEIGDMGHWQMEDVQAALDAGDTARANALRREPALMLVSGAVNPRDMRAGTHPLGWALERGAVDQYGTVEAFKDVMRERGFDGVVVPHFGNDAWVAIPFSNEQIQLERAIVGQGVERTPTVAGQELVDVNRPPSTMPAEVPSQMTGGTYVAEGNPEALMSDQATLVRQKRAKLQRANYELYDKAVTEAESRALLQNDTFEAAKDALLKNRRDYEAAQLRLAGEHTNLTAQARTQLESELSHRFEGTRLLEEADKLDREATQAVQEAWRTQVARNADAIRAEAHAARLEGMARVTEADMMAANQKALTAEEAVAKFDEPFFVTKVQTAMRDGMSQLSKQTLAPTEITNILHEMSRFTTKDDLGVLMKSFDYLTKVFKSYALMTPGFHFRNFFGGMFNNALHGVEMTAYRDFLKADNAYLRALRTGASHEAALATVPEHLRDTYRQVQPTLDLFGATTGIPQFADAAEVQSLRDVGKGGQTLTNNTLTRVGRRAGDRVERALRGSMAFHDIEQGLGREAVLDNVFKYHFDYEDLSKFEQSARKVVPFYTWTRKNLPLMLESIVRKPRAFSRYASFKRNVEMGVQEEGIVPAWYRNTLTIHLGGDKYLFPELPFKDINKITSPNELLGMVNPVIKTPAEVLLNRRAYNGQEFRPGYVDVPVAYQAFGLGEGLKMMGLAQEGKDGQLQARESILYGVEQFMPALGRARRLAPSEEKYQGRLTTTYLSFMFGIGARTNTEQDKENELWQRTRALDTLSTDYESLGYDTYRRGEIDMNSRAGKAAREAGQAAKKSSTRKKPKLGPSVNTVSV